MLTLGRSYGSPAETRLPTERQHFALHSGPSTSGHSTLSYHLSDAAPAYVCMH